MYCTGAAVNNPCPSRACPCQLLVPQEQQRQGIGGSLMLFKHSIVVVDEEDRAWPVQVGDMAPAGTALPQLQSRPQTAGPTFQHSLPVYVVRQPPIRLAATSSCCCHPRCPACSTKASCLRGSATFAWVPAGATCAAPTQPPLVSIFFLTVWHQPLSTHASDLLLLAPLSSLSGLCHLVCPALLCPVLPAGDTLALERWTHDRNVVHLRILRPAQAQAQALLDALPAGLQLPPACPPTAAAGMASLGGLLAEDAAVRTLALPLQLQAMLGAAAAAQAAAAHDEQQHQLLQPQQEQQAEGAAAADQALAASMPPTAAAGPEAAALSAGASSPTAFDGDASPPAGHAPADQQPQGPAGW